MGRTAGRTRTRVVVGAERRPAQRAARPAGLGRPMRPVEVVFSKGELIELSGVLANNLPTLSSRRWLRPAVPVTRGKRPIYAHGEVFKLGLMERMREVGVPYRVSGPLVDELRAGSAPGDPAGTWFKATAGIVPGRLVWAAIADGAGGAIWCWRPDLDTPRAEVARSMLGRAPLPAGGFRSYVVLDVSELAQRIGAAAQAKHDALEAR